MNHFSRLIAALFLALLGTRAAAAEDMKTIQPVSYDLLTVDVQVAADGSEMRTIHSELRASNDAAAMQISQINVPFVANMQDVEIVEAHTLKPDGTKIPVDPDSIYEQMPQQNGQTLSVTDQRVKVILFPQFAAGDTAVYTAKIISKHPQFAGQFFEGRLFARNVSYKEVRETITAPKGLPLQVETHEVEFSQRDAGPDVIYSWHYSAPNPIPDDVVMVSPIDHLPRFFASTFKDYAELGRAYAAQSEPKIAVTAKVGALANQITSGESDRREQAKKIYGWVSKHIRYVAIELGRGSFIPHDPDAILANGYGDCKDHDVILQSLLKAKGIATESVLINSGNGYTLTNVPTFVLLDHVITYLPEFKLYLDSSAAIAPFGVLPFEEYGKPIVRTSASGASQGTMPLLQPGVATVDMTTSENLDKQGVLTGTTKVTATGPSAMALRVIGIAIQAMGPANAASQMPALLGRPGATGTLSADPPMELSPSYTIKGEFTSPGWTDEASGKSSFFLPPGLRLLGLTGDGIMGPFNPGEMKDSEQTPCFNGHASETLSLQAPPDVKFSSVPSDTRVETPNILFTAHWSLAGGRLTVHREFTGKIDQPLCAGAVRTQAAVALKQIWDSYSTNISFDRSVEDADKAINANPNDAEAFDDRGIAHAKAGQYALAIADYDQAIKLKPDEAQYYYNRGLAYDELGQRVRAFEDFDKAVTLKPDDPDFLESRGYTNRVMNQSENALQDLNKAVALKPDYALAHFNLGAVYFSMGQLDRALQEYDQAIKLDPGYYYSYYDRGSVNLNLKEYARAIEDFSRAIALKSDDTDIFFRRGSAYFNTHKFALALKDFDKAITLKPDNAWAFMMRSYAKRVLGDTYGANTDVAKAIKLDPKLAK